MAGAVLGTLEYLISVDSSKMNKGLASAEGRVKGFGDKLSSWAVAKGQMIARFAEKAVSSIGNVMKSALTESMSFDKTMSQVAATMGKTMDDAVVQQLSEFARKMGAETAFTAEEAAHGLNYMALAGYDAEKSMNMLPKVLNLAAAGNFDLARASDMVTDAQSALGLSIEETEAMIDEMAMAASKTNTSVEQLGDAFLTVGGTAKQLKGGTEELAIALGILADNGIKGTEGGTALRNVLQRLTAPTTKAAKQLKALGVEAFDSEGNLRELQEIFLDFNDVMSNKTTQERAEVFSEIFNVRDLKSVEALIGTSADRWKELYEAMAGSEGSAAKMAETQLDNLQGDVTKLNSAFGETKLALIEDLTPAFRLFVQGATTRLQRLTEAFKEGGLKGAIDEAKKMLDEFIAGLKASDNPVLQKLGAALEVVKTTLGLLVGLIFDFPGTVQRLRQSDKPVLQLLGKALETIKTAFDIIVGLINDWDGTVEKLKQSDSPVLQTIGLCLSAIAWVFNWIIDHQQLVIDAVGAMLAAFAVSKIAGFVASISPLSLILAAVAAAAMLIIDNWEPIKQFFTDLWENVKTAAEKAYKKVSEWWTGIKEAVVAAWNTVAGWIDTNVWQPIKKFFEPMWSAVKAFWDDPLGTISNAWQQVAEWVRTNITEPIIQFFNDVITTVQGAIDKVRELLTLKFTRGLTQSTGKGLTNAYFDATGADLSAETKEAASDMVGDVAGTAWDMLWSSLFGNAKGNWRVPYDNYPALLHRDEMVLNKSQARQFRDGEQGVNIGENIGEEIRTAMGRINVVINGEKVGDMTTRRVDKNITARKYSRLRAMGG